MDTYKGEEILSSMSARIHPADKIVPDCKCDLLLSESHLFVIEDNYDGTYTDHYVIDVKYIDDILVSDPNKTQKDPAPGSAADLRKQATEDLNRRSPWRRFYKNNSKNEFLEVIYNDDSFVRQHLFFDECDKQPAGFINEFKKITGK